MFRIWGFRSARSFGLWGRLRRGFRCRWCPLLAPQRVSVSVETGGCSLLYSLQRPFEQCQKTIQVPLALNTRVIDNNIALLPLLDLFRNDQAKRKYPTFTIISHHPKVSISISHIINIMTYFVFNQYFAEMSPGILVIKLLDQCHKLLTLRHCWRGRGSRKQPEACALQAVLRVRGNFKEVRPRSHANLRDKMGEWWGSSDGYQ